MMRYLGIDYGTKKIGLALSNEGGRVAFPYEIILSDSFAPSVVADLAYKENVKKIIIGESKDLQGRMNDIAKDIDNFVQKLKSFTDIPIYFEDERFSTVQAKILPQEGIARGNTARKPRNKALPARTPLTGKQVDAQAATIILQSFLDKQQNDI